MRKSIIAFIVILMIGTVFGQTKIRFATVAPEGSTWMKVMREYTKAVEDATNNEIKFPQPGIGNCNKHVVTYFVQERHWK